MPKPKPLVSSQPDPNPKDVMFRHFGVLDDGKRSKGAAIFSITFNIGVALIIVVLGMIVKTNPAMAKKLATLTLAPKPIPPKPPPPKPLPTPPKIKLEEPKIKPPELLKQPPPEIKPVVVPLPKAPQLTPPAPKLMTAPAAPKVVSMTMKPMAASIANNDAHPSPVRLGNPELKALNTKPVGATPVNMGGGMHGMPPGNVGSGPPSKVPSFGNGSPSSGSLKGNSPVAVKGLGNGVVGGTGTGNAGPVRPVQIAGPPPPAQAKPQPVAAGPPQKPTVIYKPEPVYSAEAKAMHLEGAVTIHIKVRQDGSVEVVGVVHGLGHGLDENAVAAAKGTRFKPPVDANGHPTELDMNILVRFQLS